MAPLDPGYDFTQGFQNYCWSKETRDRKIAEEAARVKALMLALQPGDWFMSSGQYSHQVVEVGMYDGWPYWKPTPAVSYVGPLGSIEYEFYNNVGEDWSRKPSGASAAAPQGRR